MTDEIVWIDIDELGIDVCNMRAGEPYDIDHEFWDDVKNNGINYPLLVRPHQVGERKIYGIVHGRRRFDAALQEGLHKLPCIVKEMDDFTSMGRSFAENKHRMDAPAYIHAQQIGKMYELLKSEGVGKQESVNRLMKATGLRESSTYEYLSICSLPKYVFELMKPPDRRSLSVRELLLLVKRRDSATESKVLTYNIAVKVARVLGDGTACPATNVSETAVLIASRIPGGIQVGRMFEVAAVAVDLGRESASRLIELAKEHPETPANELLKDAVELAAEREGRRLTINLDAETANALKEKCVNEQVYIGDLARRYVKEGVKDTGLQPSPEVKTSVPELSEPAQPAHQPPLSPEIRTYLETSGLSAEGTEKLLSNPLWLAHPDDEKKRVIDNNAQVEKELAEDAARMKKLEEEREANWKRIKEEERNDPNRNPKTADPDVIFWCSDCNASFRIKHSDRESCPACHFTNIQYNDFAMSCGGGNCWRPRPLKDSLTICPCGCGYGHDNEGKWHSPAQYEGVMV